MRHRDGALDQLGQRDARSTNDRAQQQLHPFIIVRRQSNAHSLSVARAHGPTTAAAAINETPESWTMAVVRRNAYTAIVHLGSVVDSQLGSEVTRSTAVAGISYSQRRWRLFQWGR
jgi:hypothetical protein